jgi:putative Mg2+ transporter-C (MgtC) family protein
MMEMGWDEVLSAPFWIRLAVALACGGAVGFERQLRGKPAGMRTSMLVVLGTVLYVRLGATLSGEHVDPSRVLGQVVTGIGFLGAGVILTRGGQVLGITSAAVMWVLAAIGGAIALDRMGAAVATTITMVLVLVGLNQIERAFGSMRRGVHGEDTAETENRYSGPWGP